jgi:hypothetical protein
MRPSIPESRRRHIHQPMIFIPQPLQNKYHWLTTTKCKPTSGLQHNTKGVLDITAKMESAYGIRAQAHKGKAMHDRLLFTAQSLVLSSPIGPPIHHDRTAAHWQYFQLNIYHPFLAGVDWCFSIPTIPLHEEERRRQTCCPLPETR